MTLALNIVALVLLAVSSTQVELKLPGAVPKAAADTQDARVLTPEEFRRADIQARTRIMAAWATGISPQAGNAILPMLEAA